MDKEMSDNFEIVNAQLLRMLPSGQCREVFGQAECDIEPGFLGFVGIYKSLSEIIPKHFTVVDFGCCYAPQSFYFNKHKAYLGIDVMDGIRFKADNTTHYIMSIEDFISNHLKEIDTNKAFAICSYVPPWGGDNMKMVRENFTNVFVYYPCGDYENIFQK